jgi:hypothetical protein
MPNPQSQAPHQPTRHPTDRWSAALIHGRLRWLHRLPQVACWHATASTGPRFHEDGKTARPGNSKGPGPRPGPASASPATHRRPRGPPHREQHRPDHVPGGRERPAGAGAVGLPVVAWRDQAEHAAESLTKGSRVVVVGRLQQRAWTAEEQRPIRGRGAGRGAEAKPAMGDSDDDQGDEELQPGALVPRQPTFAPCHPWRADVQGRCR